MNDLIILLKFQLFNHCLFKKNVAIVSLPPPHLPPEEPRTYNWPSRQEAIKRKSNTWGALSLNLKKARSIVGMMGTGLHNCQIRWLLKTPLDKQIILSKLCSEVNSEESPNWFHNQTFLQTCLLV